MECKRYSVARWYQASEGFYEDLAFILNKLGRQWRVLSREMCDLNFMYGVHWLLCRKKTEWAKGRGRGWLGVIAGEPKCVPGSGVESFEQCCWKLWTKVLESDYVLSVELIGNANGCKWDKIESNRTPVFLPEQMERKSCWCWNGEVCSKKRGLVLDISFGDTYWTPEWTFQVGSWTQESGVKEGRLD